MIAKSCVLETNLQWHALVIHTVHKKNLFNFKSSICCNQFSMEKTIQQRKPSCSILAAPESLSNRRYWTQRPQIKDNVTSLLKLLMQHQFTNWGIERFFWNNLKNKKAFLEPKITCGGGKKGWGDWERTEKYSWGGGLGKRTEKYSWGARTSSDRVCVLFHKNNEIFQVYRNICFKTGLLKPMCQIYSLACIFRLILKQIFMTNKKWGGGKLHSGYLE